MGLMINAECGIGDAVYLRITGKELAPLVQRLLFEQFGREVTPEVTNCYGRSVAEFGFVSSKLAAALTELSDAGQADVTLLAEYFDTSVMSRIYELMHSRKQLSVNDIGEIKSFADTIKQEKQKSKNVSEMSDEEFLAAIAGKK